MSSWCEWLVVLGSNATATDDHSVTIAAGILGIIYGVAALSAFIFVVIPRLMTGSAAAGGPAVGASRAVPIGVARRRVYGMRWSPAHGGDLVRAHPGAYGPREVEKLQRVSRLYAAPNRRFPVLNQVSLLCTARHAFRRVLFFYLIGRSYEVVI